MANLKARMLQLLSESPGLTDREITDRLFDTATGQQPVNRAARELAVTAKIFRRAREDGKLGNYLPNGEANMDREVSIRQNGVPGSDMLSEDEVKRRVQQWLEQSGWKVTVIWGRGRGIDVEAKKGTQRWIIEAKGCGSLNPMRVNYFVSMLGELLQRMNDANARYSIALPDLKQFRGLWARLPDLAKSRTGISALFVNESGDIDEA
jgi:hypothetical protein